MKAKRRRLNSSFKAKVGLESLKELKTLSELSKEFDVHPNQISKWKNEIIERLPEIFEQPGKLKEKEEQESLINRLYQQIGQLQVELDWVKKKCGY